jgi:hypothetical protein
MEKFLIENKGGYDYITSLEHGFTLKVIPPDKREEDPEYPPYQVVSAVFDEDEEPPAWVTDPNGEMPDDWVWDESNIYDFEGMNIYFADDDVIQCNKEKWIEAINYYCQLKLDKAVITVRPYNYNFEFSELNCDPETLQHLNGEITFEEYQKLMADKKSELKKA